ncbi:putative Uncharacterized 50.6 kDa protein in the 5'region of gyrA and gyrB [Burkholderia cepacia]|nr:putative Uncharacterized 50.6 kDa protein in the 5'region of gyrA and gyrB [Burkholderia cepacia]
MPRGRRSAACERPRPDPVDRDRLRDRVPADGRRRDQPARLGPHVLQPARRRARRGQADAHARAAAGAGGEPVDQQPSRAEPDARPGIVELEGARRCGRGAQRGVLDAARARRADRPRADLRRHGGILSAGVRAVRRRHARIRRARRRVPDRQVLREVLSRARAHANRDSGRARRRRAGRRPAPHPAHRDRHDRSRLCDGRPRPRKMGAVDARDRRSQPAVHRRARDARRRHHDRELPARRAARSGAARVDRADHGARGPGADRPLSRARAEPGDGRVRRRVDLHEAGGRPARLADAADAARRLRCEVHEELPAALGPGADPRGARLPVAARRAARHRDAAAAARRRLTDVNEP